MAQAVISVPLEYPAVARNFECTTALYNVAKAKGIEPYVGITASSDTSLSWSRKRYDTYSGKVYRDYHGYLNNGKI